MTTSTSVKTSDPTKDAKFILLRTKWKVSLLHSIDLFPSISFVTNSTSPSCSCHSTRKFKSIDSTTDVGMNHSYVVSFDQILSSWSNTNNINTTSSGTVDTNSRGIRSRCYVDIDNEGNFSSIHASSSSMTQDIDIDIRKLIRCLLGTSDSCNFNHTLFVSCVNILCLISYLHTARSVMTSQKDCPDYFTTFDPQAKLMSMCTAAINELEKTLSNHTNYSLCISLLQYLLVLSHKQQQQPHSCSCSSHKRGHWYNRLCTDIDHVLVSRKQQQSQLQPQLVKSDDCNNDNINTATTTSNTTDHELLKLCIIICYTALHDPSVTVSNKFSISFISVIFIYIYSVL